jgi:hypothetical protein
VAFERYEIAFLLAVLKFMLLFKFGKVKKDLVSNGDQRE